MSEAAPVPPWLDEIEYPFHRGVVEVDGHRIHHVDHGRGPVLLMLHGNPTWSYLWRGVIARLSGRYRCVVPDLPGFGLSVAPDGFDGRPESIAPVLQAFVERLDLTDVVLVAQDWGGPIGVALVERMPDRFAGVALGSTWAWAVEHQPHFAVFSRLLGNAVAAALIRRLNLFVNLLIPLGHHRHVPQCELRQYRRALATPARRQASAVMPRAILASTPFLAEVEAGLPALRDRPALLLWADHDPVFREQELQRWRQELPQAEVARITGASHFLQADAPEQFADAVADWHARAFPAGS